MEMNLTVWKKIKKLTNPKMMNLLQRKINIKIFCH